MPYDARVVKVFIASPGDVLQERGIVREVLTEWNYIHSEDRKLVLMPVGWETHSSPALGDRPQAIINKQVLSNCDLLIAVFWTRLGSPTEKAASGTVEEVEEHLRAGKPAMLYFSSAPVRLESVEEKQYAALKAFKEEYFKKGLVGTYDSIEEFQEKLRRELSQTIIRNFPSAGGAGLTGTFPEPPSVLSLGEAAKELLLDASVDPHGTVMRLRSTGGLTVQTNGKNLVTSREPRIEARWTAAVDELENKLLIRDRSHKGEVFSVTDEGYAAADALRSGK